MSHPNAEDLIAFVLRHSEKYTEAELRALPLIELVMIKISVEIEQARKKGN
jgi:hypothetical protein